MRWIEIKKEKKVIHCDAIHRLLPAAKERAKFISSSVYVELFGNFPIITRVCLLYNSTITNRWISCSNLLFFHTEPGLLTAQVRSQYLRAVN